MFDVAKIRQDFPILSRKVYNDKSLIYLDNAATSQKPRQVIQALVEFYEGYNSNVHRGVHALSIEATEKYEEARAKLAQFIGAPSPECIVLGRNATEALNLVSYSWADQHIGPSDEILVTEMEHHSNIVPWQRIAKEKGARLRFFPITQDGVLDMTRLDQFLTPRTKLFAFTQMSNVLGTITPVMELVAAARKVGAVTLVDGAQGVPHMPTNVMELGCDFLAISGHKMLAPTGVGALYIREGVEKEMEPFLRGGDMIKEVTFERAAWNDMPYRFEAGTPNIADTIALGAAIDYLQNLGMENVRRHEIQLTKYALDAFKELEEDLTIYGPRDVGIRGGLISFYCPDIHPHDLGTFLDREGIAIRAGHHCAMPLVRGILKVPATNRASFYIYNTEEEINYLVATIKKAIRFFSPYRKPH